MSSSRSVIVGDAEVKQKIAVEVARQESFLVGCFHKPRAHGVVINHWAVASVSNPSFLRYIGDKLGGIVRGRGGCDFLCGIETAGIGIAAATSVATGTPWIYARKERKTSGSQEAFEGTYYRGAKVIFIDNMSATGKGMPEIFENARREDFVFHDLLVIIDNIWPKVEAFDAYDVKVYSLVSTQELVDELRKLDYFPGRLYEFVSDYLVRPEGWTKGSDRVREFVGELQRVERLPYIKYESCGWVMN